MIGEPIIKFNIPNYSETDSECPVVTSHQIYDKTCTTLSTVFESSSDITSSLSSGVLSAIPVDKTTA